ncbi:inner centromere protein-like isoform X2 [Ptychodera flava]|uniref:inner centromere protein-like isoform X2 n=1 Tax=Ptychodera flava TaxID=63121 RepID=UPI003969BD8F
MGSGGSKGSQATKGSEVVANVILPGQSQAVTVRGTVAQPKSSSDHAGDGDNIGSNRPQSTSSRPQTASRPMSGRRSKTPLGDSGGQYHKPSAMVSGADEIRPKSASSTKKGTATVTEVAPNKYTVEYDNQVIDISGSDFSSFLANTAEMNVTNKENVTNPFLEASSGRKFQVEVMAPKSGEGPLKIQLPQQDSVLLEDLEDDIEEIFEPLANKENLIPEFKKTERKEQLRQALQVKKTQLSKEEYEQMIANHKQEVEIMEMIRTKEKQRQKVSLEEKMTQRKLRKTRMAAEQRQKELMEVEQDDAGIDENRKKEMEAEIARRNAEFERELQVKKQQLSEAELELILAEHKQNMLELARDFERNEERQKLALAEKIAKERKRGQHGKQKKKRELSWLPRSQQMLSCP